MSREVVFYDNRKELLLYCHISIMSTVVVRPLMQRAVDATEWQNNGGGKFDCPPPH